MASSVFLSNQCILVLRITLMLVIICFCRVFVNFSLIIYLIFVLIILRGVIVIYVYFSSLGGYGGIKVEINFYVGLTFFFFFFFFEYEVTFNAYYVNRLYYTIFCLLVYLLLVLLAVAKFLRRGNFSLRSK